MTNMRVWYVGFFQRLDKMRKNAFGSMIVFGEDNKSTISGVWFWRGDKLAFTVSTCAFDVSHKLRLSQRHVHTDQLLACKNERQIKRDCLFMHTADVCCMYGNAI